MSYSPANTSGVAVPDFSITAKMLLKISIAVAFVFKTIGAVTVAEAASHVIFSYSGATPPAELISLAGKCAIGGLILFKDNITPDLAKYIQKLQTTYLGANCAINSPLLIVTDQEGGQVRRLPGGPSQSEKQIGNSSNPSAAASTAGTEAAQALKAYSFNGNLAPVLDVFRTPGDFDDQYQRSYSNNAITVASCGASFVAAQQSATVAAAVKHFPGLGAATSAQDTDARPVTINLSLNELRSVDEEAFRKAIAGGVSMVMPSWALYPALDATYPSGVSQAWLLGELRQRLGFGGVIISDAIEAGGLNMFGSDVGFRARLAVNAGQDVILAAARDVTQGKNVTNALIRNINNGSIPLSNFQASTARIAALRKSLA